MRPSTSSFPRRSNRKIPLLVVLVVPFALQILTAVGLAGYLSYRNGQQTVSNLAGQLAAEVGNRLEQNLMRDLRMPTEMPQNAAAAMQLGLLHSRDRQLLQRLLEQQLQRFDSVNAIAIADEQQKLFAAGKRRDGSIAIRMQEQFSNEALQRYLASSLTADLQPFAATSGQQHPALDSWYLAAKSAQKPFWRLAEGLTAAGQPTLSAVNVQPLYDRSNRFQGVLASSISLSALSSALQRLKIAKTGQAFIVEQNGLLIANSNGDRPFRQSTLTKQPFAKGQLLASIGSTQAPVFYQRVNAVKSHDVLTEQTALAVVEQFGGFDRIQTVQQFSFEIDRQRYFVHIEPLGRDEDLDWLAVVVVPEADFIDAINSNHRLTLLLCAGALIVAVVVGWLTSTWIARPILRLSRASRELALGKWSHPIDSQHQVAELEVLAHSFNQMTVHLQASFDQVTTALQESEAKFTKVFRASPDAISITTLPERRYIDVNDRFVEFTGYTRKEAIGQSALSLNLAVNLEQVARFEHALQTQNRVHDVEIDYRTKQGQLRTVLVSSEVIELEGQPRLLCIYRDVTLRKQLELALQRSETKLNDVLNSAIASITSIHIFPDGTWHYDYWSKGCETVFGYAPDEFMADRTLWLTRVPPEDLERVLVVNTKQLQEQQTFVTQYRFRHKDGTLRWISGYITSRWDAALNAWIATAVDVDMSTTVRVEAERKQAEEALRESEQRFRNAFDTTAVSMCLTAPDGQFVQVNPSLCQMLGYTEAELLKLTFAELTHPDDLSVTLEYAQRLLAGEISYYHLEKRYQHKNGQTIWCLLSVSLVRDRAQQPLYFVAQMQDTTAQQAALYERQCAENATRAVNVALNQRLAELSTLNHITQTVTTVTALPAALTAAAALITDRFKAREADISLLNEQRTAVEIIANHHLDPAVPSLVGKTFLIAKDYIATRVFECQESVVLTVTETTPGAEYSRRLMQARNIYCLMTVGLWMQGEPIGAMTIATEEWGRVFTPDEVKLAETIAGQIAGAIQNARLFEALQRAKESAEGSCLARMARHEP